MAYHLDSQQKNDHMTRWTWAIHISTTTLKVIHKPLSILPCDIIGLASVLYNW